MQVPRNDKTDAEVGRTDLPAAYEAKGMRFDGGVQDDGSMVRGSDQPRSTLAQTAW